MTETLYACLVCGDPYFGCIHFVLSWNRAEINAGGGAYYDVVDKLLSRLNDSMTAAAKGAPIIAVDDLSDLLVHASKITKEDCDPEDVYVELTPEVREFVEDLLFEIPETHIKEHIIVYDGFPAEDVGYLFWSSTPEVGQQYLEQKLASIRSSVTSMPEV